VFCFVASEQRTGTKQSCIRAGDIRIQEQQQLVTAAPTTYGLRFRRANTFWKAPGVFICIKPQVQIMLEPVTIIIFVQRPFSPNGAVTPYFGPLDRVSC
jgi:hypothetical protein